MEELLNKLIERGWKPMGHKPLTDEIKKKVKVERYNRKPTAIVIKNGRKYADDYYSLREIVSKESGLWQFVCENEMIKHNQYTNTTRIQEYEDERDSETCRKKYDEGSYLFRLIESALKDESELESFILDNIKV